MQENVQGTFWWIIFGVEFIFTKGHIVFQAEDPDTMDEGGLEYRLRPDTMYDYPFYTVTLRFL